MTLETPQEIYERGYCLSREECERLRVTLRKIQAVAEAAGGHGVICTRILQLTHAALSSDNHETT